MHIDSNRKCCNLTQPVDRDAGAAAARREASQSRMKTFKPKKGSRIHRCIFLIWYVFVCLLLIVKDWPRASHGVLAVEVQAQYRSQRESQFMFRWRWPLDCSSDTSASTPSSRRHTLKIIFAEIVHVIVCPHTRVGTDTDSLRTACLLRAAVVVGKRLRDTISLYDITKMPRFTNARHSSNERSFGRSVGRVWLHDSRQKALDDACAAELRNFELMRGHLLRAKLIRFRTR